MVFDVGNASMHTFGNDGFLVELLLSDDGVVMISGGISVDVSTDDDFSCGNLECPFSCGNLECPF